MLKETTRTSIVCLSNNKDKAMIIVIERTFSNTNSVTEFKDFRQIS